MRYVTIVTKNLKIELNNLNLLIKKKVIWLKLLNQKRKTDK